MCAKYGGMLELLLFSIQNGKMTTTIYGGFNIPQLNPLYKCGGHFFCPILIVIFSINKEQYINIKIIDIPRKKYNTNKIQKPTNKYIN
jgi:hypothetical protein